MKWNPKGIGADVVVAAAATVITLLLPCLPTLASQSPEQTATTPPGPDLLPGKGLAQHPFLYCGEWDTRKPVQTIFLVRDGKVVWTYTIPTNDEHHVLQEFDDIHLLSNGNILYARKTGATEITQDKKVVWNYDCPTGTECHSAQPIGLDKVLIVRNGNPAKLMLINTRTGKVEMEHELETARPGDPKQVHGEFRHARRTQAGTYLVPHMNLGKVVEYDKDWKVIWSCPAESPWAAVRLKNGNTLISGNQHGYVREVNSKGETVWEIKKDDLIGFPLHTVQEVNRLANGDTVICNWTGGVKKPDWPTIIQIIEVSPEKKVVWALHEWKDPDLGPASCIQLLDEPGVEESGDLQR